MGRHFLRVPWKTPGAGRGLLWWCLITRRENLDSEARRRPWPLSKPSFLSERKFFACVGARRACSCCPHCGNRAGIRSKIPHPAQARARAGGGPGPEQGFDPETLAGLAPASLTFCGQVRPSLSLGPLEEEMGAPAAARQQLCVGSGPTCSWGLPGGRGWEEAVSHSFAWEAPTDRCGLDLGAAGRGRGRGTASSGGPFRKQLGPDQTPQRLRGARPASLLRPTGARRAGDKIASVGQTGE